MRLIPFIAALLIAAGLYYWFELRHGPDGEAMAIRTQAPVEAAESAADPADVPVPVMVLPSEARETSAETTGRVVSEPLRRGAEVEAGQVLCRLDPGVREAELAETEAALAEAEVQASGAAQLERKGYAAETTLRERQAQLRAAQARLDKVRQDIQRLEIRAPFGGMLEADTAELGKLLSPGAVCAEIVDLDRVTVRGYVSEQAVDRLRLGQPAQVRLIDGTVATGEVTFISRMADEETRTFAVDATLPNADHAIRHGMTAELLIALPPRTAHLVPQSALTLDDDGRLGVRTAAAGIAEFHPVTILRDTAQGVWVDGLPGRADIIVMGQEFVRAGRRVEATPVSPDQLR